MKNVYLGRQPIIDDQENLVVFELNNMLLAEDNIEKYSVVFKELSYQLLQFINSGYFHFRNRIATIHHVLTLVGRIAIGQWLMLMVYSKSVTKKSERSPLMQTVLKTVQPEVKNDMLGEAYMVGVLSLVDTIFSMELEDILETINISSDVKDALLNETGLLGEIYTQVKCTENFDIRSAYNFEKKYNLKHKTIENLVLECMQEVQNFETPKVT